MDWSLVGGNPVPVDVEAVQELARVLKDRALDLYDWHQATGKVIGATPTVWQGKAAIAFEAAGTAAVQSMRAWPDRLESASLALRTFAGTAEDLQIEARRWLNSLPDPSPPGLLAGGEVLVHNADPTYTGQLELVRRRIEGIGDDYRMALRRVISAIQAENTSGVLRRGPAGAGIADSAEIRFAEALAAAERSQDYDSAARLLASMSVSQRATLFADLTSEAKQLMAANDPLIGNLNGVPLSVRAAANAVQLRHDLALARREHDQEWIDRLSMLAASGGGLVLYDPAHDHYGVMYGDIDTAAHVAVMVPGVGDDNSLHGWLGDAMRLQRKAEQAGEGTAVIMWKGYDNPGDHGTLDKANAALTGRAQEGAADLASFATGLGLRRDQSFTVVAHSYGTVVTGTALAQDGLHPTNVVSLGSPGMTVDGVDELHLQPGQFYAEKAPGDPVANALAGFGVDPTSFDFGGTRLATNAFGKPSVNGHAQYFTQRSQALNGIRDVVVGRVSPADVQQTTAADAVGTIVGHDLDPTRDPLDTAAREYGGPLSGQLQLAVHVHDGLDNGLGTVARNTVELPRKAAEQLDDFARDISHFFL